MQLFKSIIKINFYYWVIGVLLVSEVLFEWHGHPNKSFFFFFLGIRQICDSEEGRMKSSFV